MTKDFHTHIRRTLRIPAAPLSSRIETIGGPLMKNETRIKACSKQIIHTIRIPGFLYQQAWIGKEMSRQGFTPDETEKSITFLIDKGILKDTEAGLILITSHDNLK